MRYRDIKRLQREIARLRSELDTIEGKATRTTQVLTDMPSGGGVSDKPAEYVVASEGIASRIEFLEMRIKKIIMTLPNTIEGNCIYMKVVKGYSWAKIAAIVGGNTENSIRMACHRYHW